MSEYKNEESSLASRGQRLQAAIIDNLIIIVPMLILVMLYPQKEAIPDVVSIIVGLYMVMVMIIQVVFLSSTGQTVGKKMINIQIIRSNDGKNGGFVSNVLLRAFVNGLIGLIPLYHLIDTLFIFSDTKRCLHDRIAGTTVVKKTANQV